VRLVGEGDVDGVAFDDAVAGGWGLGDDCAGGGDCVSDWFGGCGGSCRRACRGCCGLGCGCRGVVGRLRSSALAMWRPMAAVRGGALRTLPGVHGCDGFFAVVLERV